MGAASSKEWHKADIRTIAVRPRAAMAQRPCQVSRRSIASRAFLLSATIGPSEQGRGGQRGGWAQQGVLLGIEHALPALLIGFILDLLAQLPAKPKVRGDTQAHVAGHRHG